MRRASQGTIYMTLSPSPPVSKKTFASFAFSSDWKWPQWAGIYIWITRLAFTKGFFLTLLPAASSHHRNLLLHLLRRSFREAGDEPMIIPVVERLSEVIAEKDCPSSFLNDSKRRLLKLNVQVINEKIDKKKLWLGHWKPEGKGSRV